MKLIVYFYEECVLKFPGWGGERDLMILSSYWDTNLG